MIELHFKNPIKYRACLSSLHEFWITKDTDISSAYLGYSRFLAWMLRKNDIVTGA